MRVSLALGYMPGARCGVVGLNGETTMDLKAIAVVLAAMGGCAADTSDVEPTIRHLDPVALCKLHIGVEKTNDHVVPRLGTWIDDAAAILGLPKERSKDQFYYEYDIGKGFRHPAWMRLTFVQKSMCWKDMDGKPSDPVVPSLWLADIEVGGGMGYADCWDPERPASSVTPSPESIDERTVVSCSDESGGK